MSATLRRLLALAFALGVVFVGKVAAASPSVRLSYSEGAGVTGCPPESRLREAVISRLGEDPFDPAAARSFRVEIVAVGAGLEGRVTLTGEGGNVDGARRFEGGAGHCTDLMAAMALAISLAINPDLVVEEPTTPAQSSEGAEPAEPATPSMPEPQPEVPPLRAQERLPAPQPEPDAAQQPERDEPPWRFALGAGVSGAWGAGPEPALGAIAFGRVRRGQASLALEARFDAPFDHSVGAASVHARLLAGALAPCLHFAFARGCWAALAGDVAAGSRGVSRRLAPHGFFAATGPRAGVEWPLLESLSVSAQLDGLVTVRPVRIVLDGRQIWRTPPVSAALALAAVWQIP